MKLPELKEKLKSKYIVRVVAGVLTIALVGTGIGATAVFAEKDSTAVTAEADSTTDSSKDADDIADKLMDSVSLKDNDADKDESVYLISDANGNVNKTIVVDHLKNKDKKDTLEDASNLSDIENVKGKEKFTQSGDKLTWQAGGKDIYYQGTATAEPPVTQKVTYYLDGKEISPEDLAGKSGKVKIRFDYTNTTSYTETVNGEKQTVSVPFAAVTGLVLGDGFENIEVTNGKAEVSDSSSVVLGYALPGLKDSLGIKDKDLDDDVNIPEYMEMTADVENFSMPAAMTFVVNASDYVSTDGIDTSDLDDMINDLKDASTQLQDGSKTLAEGTDTLSDGLSTLQSKLGTFSSGVGTLQSGLKTYTDGVSTLSGGLNTLGNSTGALVSGADKLNDGAKSLKAGITSVDAGVDSVQENVNKLNGAAAQISTGASDLDTKAQALAQGASDLNDGVEKLASTVQGMPETVKSSINDTLKQLSSFVPVLIVAGYDNTLAQTGVTVDNVDKVTTFAKEKEAEIKEIIARSATKNAHGYNELPDKSEVDKTYNKAMEGLYQGQGAVMVYTQINQTVSSEQSQNQVKKLTEGAISLKENTAKFQKEGTTKLKEGTSALATGTSALASGLTPLKEGTKQLVAGSNSLAEGMDSLANSVPTLTSGIKQLVDGSNTLVANNAQLNSGASQLADGTNQIVSGVDQLTTGSKTLSEGAHTLADGIVQFNEEGINKILDAYNGDLKPFTNKLQAVIDAGEEYQTYSAIADGQTGSVKFIYKLASIDAKADSDK